MNCPECHRHESYGCRFDCSIHQPPSDPRDYRRWADEQIRQYAKERNQ